ncbi:MAG: hypothetical protein HUU21_26980 [Polyangiaceae bacterium]|nr:hypothetical protein [Polyangiaceae bacterium]
MPQPEAQSGAAPPERIGPRSTLFLVLSYWHKAGEEGGFSLDGFETTLLKTNRWKRKSIDDAGLLPHLDAQVEQGIIIRAFEATAELANMFDPRAVWSFQRPPRKSKGGEAKADAKIGAKPEAKPEAKESKPAPCVNVKILGAPTLYVMKTGYVFIVLGVRPAGDTLKEFQDAYACLVRRGWNHLTPETLPRKKAGAGGESKPHPLALLAEAQGGIADTSLRHWLALLVPDLEPAPPQGGRKSPMAIIALFAAEPLSRGEQYRIRLAHHSDQIEPPPDDDESDLSTVWRPSALEQCLFSPISVTWIVYALEPGGFLGRFDETLRDRYIYKWILVEHQRLRLIWLSAMCAKMSDAPDARTFRWLGLELLNYTAIYDFGHISSEERHDKFYRAMRRALDVDGLFAEVKDEINEINNHLSAEREAILNEVLAFLALVLTPVGLVIGIYQRETLPPEPFELRFLVSARAWATLLTHWPFWFVVMSAVTGGFVFTRVLGASSVRRLLERLRFGSDRRGKGRRRLASERASDKSHAGQSK